MFIHPIVTLSFALVIAAILLAAASHKLRAPHRFARQLEAYELLPAPSLAVAVRALPILEVLIAVALLVPALRGWGAVSAAALLVLYTGAIAINLLRGRAGIDCGCSGPGLEQPLGRALLVRNAVLVALAVVVALPSGGAALHAFGLFLIVACASAGLTLYIAVEGLLANQPRLKSLSGR